MLDAILKGLTIGFLLSISVGPIIFSIIKQSLSNGVKAGLAFIAGISLSDISIAVATNFFTELFNNFFYERRTQIGIIGSTFLISVGFYFLFFKKVKVDEQGKQILFFRKRDYAKISVAGFLMNTLNPALIIFWLTAATAFINHTLQQRIIIFSIAIVIVVAADLMKVFLAGKLRQRLTARNISVINRVNGIILIGFAIILLWGLVVYGDKLSQ